MHLRLLALVVIAALLAPAGGYGQDIDQLLQQADAHSKFQ